jgi:hypothetical protein
MECACLQQSLGVGTLIVLLLPLYIGLALQLYMAHKMHNARRLVLETCTVLLRRLTQSSLDEITTRIGDVLRHGVRECASALDRALS